MKEKLSIKLKNFFNQEYVSLDKDIKMYVCGPTTYDHVHVGNIRPVIIFDVIHRLLKLGGNKVLYIHNLTDIDDKVIKRAKLENKTELELSSHFINEYLSIIADLNVLMPENLPKVSDHIDGMVTFIDELISKNYAYLKNGSVYFDTKKVKNYQKIANLKLWETSSMPKLEEKNSSEDFALWKKTKDGISFASPWSNGRPGWHTECAFFVKKYFGTKGIDIHGGGIDLRFPHHTNEMVQYFANTQNDLSRCWFYVGQVTQNYEKMSKSIGNIILAKDFIKEHSSNVLRLLLISTSYLKPIDLNENTINLAKNKNKKMENTLVKGMVKLVIKNIFNIEESYDEEFVSILANNLDFLTAFKYLNKIEKEINSSEDIKIIEKHISHLIFDLNLLGFDFKISFKKNQKDFLKFYKEKKYSLSDKIKKEFIKFT